MAKQTKNKDYIGYIIAAIILIGTITFVLTSSKIELWNTILVGRIRKCPTAWYKNEMPGIYKKNEEYLIIEGVRYEVNEVNTGWIVNNCEVNKPQVIF